MIKEMHEFWKQKKMFDEDLDSMAFYDDLGEDCDDDEQQNIHYDYDYVNEETSLDDLQNVYENCLLPSVYDTAIYLLPLLLASLFFNLITHIVIIKKLSHKIHHVSSITVGIYIIGTYLPESLHLLGIYTSLSYAYFRLPRKYQNKVGMLIFSISIILYCEYTMEPKIWHKIRSVIMIFVMKVVSISIDSLEEYHLPTIWEFNGYIFGATTCLFGPWISFKDYMTPLNNKRYQSNNVLLKIVLNNIFNAAKHFIISLFFLSISNCWMSWLLTDQSSRWVLAYRDALSFRMSHYFVSYVSSSVLLLGGYSSSLAIITKPLDIELPRSLVQVVVSWNIPMHTWLKLYVFRATIKRLGKFGALTLTYLASSLLHGFNFQLAAVLLSLGLYTYVEYQLRNILANAFDACISAKKCPADECIHEKNHKNSIWAVMTNFGFSILTVFHLSYLGLMFDSSELQETGYSYSHTINKWSELGFASHWMAALTYLTYFLVQ